MKLAALFSGGKDSTYAIHHAQNSGHKVVVLLTTQPKSDESHLLHFPNIIHTKLQSETMKIPQIIQPIDDSDPAIEKSHLDTLVKTARETFDFQGLVHGGILSDYQKNIFKKICILHKLKLISPIWHKDPIVYMKELLNDNFEFIISSVSSGGLDKYWLGKKIGNKELQKLEELSKKFQFNLNFEGGEAETFVTNCPLFKNRIKILKSKKTWDGIRGRFEIEEAELENIA